MWGMVVLSFKVLQTIITALPPWLRWDPPKEGARRRLYFLVLHVLKLGSDSLFQKLQLIHGSCFPSLTSASTSWYPLSRGCDPSPVGAPLSLVYNTSATTPLSSSVETWLGRAPTSRRLL